MLYTVDDNNNRVADECIVSHTSNGLIGNPYLCSKLMERKDMKKMVCPQCKIAAMYVKNEAGERRLVYVTSEGEVVPKKEDESLEGFNLEEVFCLGCSWHGSPKRLVRY